MKIFGMLRPGLADMVTIGNALCGAAAIGIVVTAPWASSAAGEDATLRIATLVALAGIVLDVCDGAVARALGGTPLGPFLDSLADAVTFGAAPAIIVGGLALRHSQGWEVGAIAVAGLIYVTAALVRLADFDAGRSRDRFFTGMPSPLAAASVLCVGLLSLNPWLITAALLALAWLMVSGIRWPHARGVALIVEAAAVVAAVFGLVGVIDMRIIAVLILLGSVVAAPAVFGVLERRHAPADTARELPVDGAES